MSAWALITGFIGGSGWMAVKIIMRKGPVARTIILSRGKLVKRDKFEVLFVTVSQFLSFNYKLQQRKRIISQYLLLCTNLYMPC